MHYEQNTYLRKQFGFCLCEKCRKLVNHLCNWDGPLTFERGGHVFHIKDKPKRLNGILKDRSTTWLSEERSHRLTTWFVAGLNRTFQQVCTPVRKQVAKAGTGSREQRWAGKTQSPGSASACSPAPPPPTETPSTAILQNALLAEKR